MYVIYKDGMKIILVLAALMWSTVSWSSDVNVPKTPTAAQFLSVCSNVAGVSPLDSLVAYANCIGRVGGYANGHQMTVDLQNLTSRKQSTHPIIQKPLWCIPSPGVSDRDLFNSVITWAEQHPQEVQRLTNRYVGVTGAYAVITRALHAQYKCK
jgi:hypothetical protein